MEPLVRKITCNFDSLTLHPWIVHELNEFACNRDANLQQKIMPLASSLVPAFSYDQLLMKCHFSFKKSYNRKWKRARETGEPGERTTRHRNRQRFWERHIYTKRKREIHIQSKWNKHSQQKYECVIISCLASNLSTSAGNRLEFENW